MAKGARSCMLAVSYNKVNIFFVRVVIGHGLTERARKWSTKSKKTKHMSLSSHVCDGECTALGLCNKMHIDYVCCKTQFMGIYTQCT